MNVEDAIDYAKPIAEGHAKGPKDRALAALYGVVMKFTAICNICGERCANCNWDTICEKCGSKELEE